MVQEGAGRGHVALPRLAVAAPPPTLPATMQPAPSCLLLCTALLATAAPAQPPPVLAGIDVLVGHGFAPLRGRTVGLVTNHTGRTWDGRRTVDVLAAAEGVKLQALFSPEHGWEGLLDEKVGDSRDAATGLPVNSLYGELRKPTKAMLEGLDTLVFDIQDIGCRFYTYVSTMGLCMEAAAEHKLRMVVLDRPNPIGGVLMEGPVMELERRDFVGWHSVPLRHGLTAGELARMIQGETGLQCDLQVIACQGWQREMTWDRTGLPWVNPSPNMRCLTQALLYPGIGVLEGTNLSVGRGTDTPFEIVGAPWCDGIALAGHLNAQAIPGVTFVPVTFTPASSKHKGERCSGVNIVITDWATFRPVATGLRLGCALRDLFPKDWKHERVDWLLREKAAYDAFAKGASAAELEESWRKELELFRLRRTPFLLYR